MRVTHSVPATEAEDHLLEHLCPCNPTQAVAARPGKPLAITITHQPFTPKEQS